MRNPPVPIVRVSASELRVTTVAAAGARMARELTELVARFVSSTLAATLMLLAAPPAIRAVAPNRRQPARSLKMTTAMANTKIMEVSRSAATTAIGA